MITIAEVSPRLRARIAGICEALEGLASTFGQVIIPGRLIVSGSAAATAAGVLGHQRLFWLGFALSLIGVLFHIAWAFLFYDLFKPVRKSISLFATFVILVGCAVQAVTAVLYVAPFLILQGGSALGAFPPSQLQGLAYLFFRLNGQAFNTYLVFFGLWCVLIGYLIFKSTFMPRILGVLLVISGLAWMMYLSPRFASHIFVYIAAASALGEIPLQLWLIVMGVNPDRWKEQAGAERNAA